MHLRDLLALCLLVICAGDASAACSDTLRGNSSKFAITITDGGCEFEAVMIFATPYKEVEGGLESLEPLPAVPFGAECEFAQGVAISCKAGGTSPLAGTRYEATEDTNPICGGDRGLRYTCVEGCERGAPPYLYWEPYEC